MINPFFCFSDSIYSHSCWSYYYITKHHIIISLIVCHLYSHNIPHISCTSHLPLPLYPTTPLSLSYSHSLKPRKNQEPDIQTRDGISVYSIRVFIHLWLSEGILFFIVPKFTEGTTILYLLSSFYTLPPFTGMVGDKSLKGDSWSGWGRLIDTFRT